MRLYQHLQFVAGVRQFESVKLQINSTGLWYRYYNSVYTHWLFKNGHDCWIVIILTLKIIILLAEATIICITDR